MHESLCCKSITRIVLAVCRDRCLVHRLACDWPLLLDRIRRAALQVPHLPAHRLLGADVALSPVDVPQLSGSPPSAAPQTHAHCG